MIEWVSEWVRAYFCCLQLLSHFSTVFVCLLKAVNSLLYSLSVSTLYIGELKQCIGILKRDAIEGKAEIFIEQFWQFFCTLFLSLSLSLSEKLSLLNFIWFVIKHWNGVKIRIFFFFLLPLSLRLHIIHFSMTFDMEGNFLNKFWSNLSGLKIHAQV